MSTPSQPFYVTGGTLRPDAACYVERKADKSLHAGLIEGYFCYVLTSRQMGKSSLMVRTVARLRGEGYTVAVLDLTAIGQNLTVEQWYTGLLERLGVQLDLEDELDEFWAGNSRLSPVQRWFEALHQVVLRSPACGEGLVIFVDEIDAVRSLKFSTDEFFAAIRECYNRRSNEADFERLTFCLLGVATPSDLIRDTRTTPFNIGRRIELRDFTCEEAFPLAGGLSVQHGEDKAARLLRRVMHWTHGHPYLTQRFCQAVLQKGEVKDEAGIDRLCEELFLSDRAREQNDNLVFVRERLIRNGQDRAGVLDLYSKVLLGRHISDDPSNPLVCVLRLSGITRGENGALKVRNRIYREVFDRKWVADNLPDAELRRQKEAYRKGAVRTAVVAILVVSLVAYLAVVAHYQAKRAERFAEQEANQRQRAEEAQQAAEEAARRATDVLSQLEMQQAEDFFKTDRASIGIAYLAHALRSHPSNHVAAARLIAALSQRSFALPAREEAPGRLETSHLWNSRRDRVISRSGEEVVILDNRGEIVTPPMRHAGRITSEEFSPDDQRVATSSVDNTVRLWDAETGEPIGLVMRHNGPVGLVRFSPDGMRLVTASADRTARLWDALTGEPLTQPIRHERGVRTAQFNADGSRVITTVFRSPRRRVWDVRYGKMLSPAVRHERRIDSVRFSPDGKRLLTASRDNTARIWDARSGEPLSPPMQHERQIATAEFSPDGRRVVTASDDHTAQLWDGESGLRIGEPMLHDRRVAVAGFSPDGRKILTASADGLVQVWAVDPVRSVVRIPHSREVLVFWAEFSNDGERILTAASDRTVRIWSASDGLLISDKIRSRLPVVSAHFSKDDRRIATTTGSPASSAAQIWDVETGEAVTEPMEHNAWVRSVRFDSEGRRVVTASADRTARIWDAVTGQSLAGPLLHNGEVVFGDFFPGDSRVVTISSVHLARVWEAASGQPLSEPYEFEHEHEFSDFAFDVHRSTDLSPDGQWLATLSNDDIVRIWEVFAPPAPVPDWLPDLAEMVGGDRINERGLLVSAPSRGLARMAQGFRHSSADGFYVRWARWFFSDRGDRSISPASPVQIPEYVNRLIEEGTERSLRLAILLVPDHAPAMARLARLLARVDSDERPRAAGSADFLSRRAVEVAPKDEDVLWMRLDVLEDLGRVKQALATLDEVRKRIRQNEGELSEEKKQRLAQRRKVLEEKLSRMPDDQRKFDL